MTAAETAYVITAPLFIAYCHAYCAGEKRGWW